MSNFKDRYGPWAFVTGAGTAIGAEFARQLAARGLDLIVSARPDESPGKLAETLRERHGVRVRQLRVDLDEPRFLSRVRSATRGLEIGLLVNHAGFTFKGPFVENDLKRELPNKRKISALNVRTPAVLARELGGQMAKRGRGAIVFIAARAAQPASPFDISEETAEHYSATLAEALWYELAPHGVDVVTLTSETDNDAEAEAPRGLELAAGRVELKVAEVLSMLETASPVIPGKLFSAMNVMGEWIFSQEISRRLKAALLSKTARTHLN